MEADRRFIEISEPLFQPSLAVGNAPVNAVYEHSTYLITALMGKHHEVFRVGVRNMNECPMLALLTNYRVAKDDSGDEWAAQNHVTLIGGNADGCYNHVPFGVEKLTLTDTYHIEEISHNGNKYRVGLADPNACAIKALILGYRKPLESDEICDFCGARTDSPCDAPPAGPCDTAIRTALGGAV